MRRPAETPNSHDNRHFVLTLNDDRLNTQRVEMGRSFQPIDGVFQEGPGRGVANEKTPVLDLDVVVENGFGRGVHVGDKSVLVESDRGQAQRIERRGWRGADPSAPATAAISIRRRMKEARIRFSATRRLQTSEFTSNKFI